MKTCEQCGIEFESVRETAKYCSPKCRVTASRKSSVVTLNVTLSEPDVTLRFKFTIKRNKQDDQPNPVREALYWYDVPLAAVPVKQKGWPDIPVFPAIGGEPATTMNGRQYFLWWKNEFKVNEDPEKGELGMPIIHNPFPIYNNVKYEMGGESSRKWGS